MERVLYNLELPKELLIKLKALYRLDKPNTDLNSYIVSVLEERINILEKNSKHS